jgi:hypothetical protein
MLRADSFKPTLPNITLLLLLLLFAGGVLCSPRLAAHHGDESGMG